MKKLIALLLAMTMLVSLCACGSGTKGEIPDADADTETTTTTIEAETTTVAETTTTGEDTTEATTTTTEAPIIISSQSTTTTTAVTTTATTTAATTTTAKKTTTATTTKKVTTTKVTTTKATTTTAAVTTTTTKKTTTEATTTTTEAEKPDNRPQLKILSIGHSFSVDAMDAYMWDLFDAAGYNVTIGYLYFPGCSLERQYHYITENRAGYHRYAKNSEGYWEKDEAVYNSSTHVVLSDGVRALTALWDEDWDIVTFQPSPDYGKGTMTYKCEWGCNKAVNDYDHFDALVDYVLDTLADPNNPNGANKDVKIYYHLTWAFSTDCKLWSYMYSDFDQMTMYQDFINATKTHVLTNEHVKGVIPCNTAIQNVRTSWMGDTFNMPASAGDGYHLNDMGDYVAALTWVSYFTGVKAKDIEYDWGYTGEVFEAMAEAVDNAIANPWQVTESSYKTDPEA